MEVKQLKDIIKIWVNARGITNGELDVNSIEYLEGSDLDKLIQFIKNNGLNEQLIVQQIIAKLNEQGDLLISKLNQQSENIILEIDVLNAIVNQIILDVVKNELAIQNNQSSLNLINNNIQQLDSKSDSNFANINNILKDLDFNSNFIIIKNIINQQAFNINKTLKEISSKIEPKIVVKKEVSKEINYIEVQTTKYVFVGSQAEVKPDQVNRINRGQIPPKEFKNKDTSWKQFYGDWLIKQANDTFYFKRKYEGDGQMLRAEDFARRYAGKGEMGVKLMELGIISENKGRELGIISTNATAPNGANPHKWKWSNSSW